MSGFAPTVHSVHFYDTDQALIHRLSAIVSSGLLTGSAVLIVATAGHRRDLETALASLGVDVKKYARERRVMMCDAEEMLSRFMVDGSPDEFRFQLSVGALVADAKQAVLGHAQGLVVFGEMVSLLWEQGNKGGALALERLWNDLLNDRAFHLHCAYPRTLFFEDHQGMMNVCESHSQIFGELAS